MDPLKIIRKYYPVNSKAYNILITHSQAVQNKALAIAARHTELPIDIPFIKEAALLHDIGIFLTNAPAIDCHGNKPYICHGYLGADLLREEGYPRHALVCERHTGAGITIDMIENQKLPLPVRTMTPESLEEQLICFADKFFSKSTDLTQEKTIEKIKQEMQKYGIDSLNRFEKLHALFQNK